MNVYDFDNTIYRGDSTVDFCKYCLRRYPGMWRWLPQAGWHGLRYALRRCDKTTAKARLFRIFRGVPDMDAALRDFWAGHAKNIKSWYPAQQRPDDVIVSASPEFLLAPICAQLGIAHLIGSRVDPGTGDYTGLNCYGEEKVPRFRAQFPEAAVERFYSDSYSDSPLAELAQESFLVQGDAMLPWGE